MPDPTVGHPSEPPSGLESARVPAPPADAGSIRRLSGLAVLLVAVVLVPFVQELTAQPAIRYAHTAAMVDDRSVELDRYRDVIGVDRVERDGHLYSDKAPLQPILATPAYAAAQLVGAEPATHLRVQGNLGLWWVTLWSTIVPLLVIVAMGVTLCSRLVGARPAAVGTVVMAFGTLLTAYGTQLYAHVLAGLLGWASWLVLSRDPGRRSTAFVAGMLGGAAVATEYPLILVVLVCAGVLVKLRVWSSLVAFCAGGVPFIGLLLGYQWLAYGSPFTISYGEKPVHASEPLVVGAPDPLQLLEVLFGSRGMMVFTPILAFAVWGLWRLASTASGERRMHGVVGLVVFGLFVLLQSGWSNPWGGEAPGPRYVVPALPFLIIGLAEAWDRLDRGHRLGSTARRVVVAWSVFVMMTTVLVNHLVPQGAVPGIHHLQRLRDEGPVDTLWTLAIGPFGWLVHLATVAAALMLFMQAVRIDRGGAAAPHDERSDRSVSAAG